MLGVENTLYYLDSLQLDKYAEFLEKESTPQPRMTFGGAPELSLCPACGYFSLRVIESRKSKLARRRRFECNKCSHRITTHEVDDAFFQQAKENERIIEKLKGRCSALLSNPLTHLDVNSANTTQMDPVHLISLSSAHLIPLTAIISKHDN
jgi:hypothetical protein